VSIIWDKLAQCQDSIIDIFDQHCDEIEEPGLSDFNQPDNGWINRVWANSDVRRAHIDVVDARATKGLWMMHVCVFPVLNNDGPVYGFDVIAGKNKMTGAFHDFSPTLDTHHPMVDDYRQLVDYFVPKKQRELPQWATNIFTDKMLAAGNVNSHEEADEIIKIALDNLQMYFDVIGEYTKDSIDIDAVKHAQNYYCANQQQNPHTPRVMKTLGLPEDKVDIFCRDMLFPKI